MLYSKYLMLEEFSRFSRNNPLMKRQYFLYAKVRKFLIFYLKFIIAINVAKGERERKIRSVLHIDSTANLLCFFSFPVQSQLFLSHKTIPSPLDLAGGFASIIILWIDRIRPSYFRLRGKSIFLYEKSISRHFPDDQIVLLLRGYTTGNS